MQKHLLLFLGFLAQLLQLSTPSFAQSKSVKHDNSLLWKISGKDLSKPSYVFGTMHSICNEDYFFTTQMKQAFEATQKLFLEIDLSDPTMIAQYQQHVMLTDGKQLRDYFSSEDEYNDFAEQIKNKLGIDASMFQQFKPFFLISMIAMKSFTCENQSSYEMNLIEMAKKNKIDIAGLESSHAQLQIFDQMNNQDIKAMLLESLQQIDEDQTEFKTMITHYKNQDIDALYNLISSSPEFKGHEKELISGRNIQWMNTLLYEMKNTPCFVAVGAGHLAGEQGVLNLLADKGYTVEAVK